MTLQVQRGIPTPKGWLDPEEDDTGFEYSSDEDNGRNNSNSNSNSGSRRGDRMAMLAAPGAAVLQTMALPVNTMHSVLWRYVFCYTIVLPFFSCL